MRMYDIIEKKRDGFELSKEEIDHVIAGFTKGHIPDYQMSALLMAIYFSDMSKEESSLLTDAMVQSGDQIDLSSIEGIKVDKHSTGGVGDTTTLTLTPLVASLGVKVAKMSGRGLGHTGGTLDKLESIEGFSIEIDNDEFIRLVNENNLAVIGQSEQLAPADKMIYSLRDVTATVNSIPLIASSIMSKKIASGADKIVLDVKCGKGAFMKEEAKAIELAQTMVAIGQQNGVGTSAIISSMEEPLGRAVGNALEMKEAIETLQGVGPDDLTELTLTLGAHMVLQAEKAASFDEAYYLLQQKLISGEALAIFKQFIAAQGGN
ncbi:MAG TPA: thymidine phosphorylase, partial [Pseudogracilibacillus sp.]|nr:thymidine phosphorylase [Pseudogracilibacillus sp.]